MITVPVVINFDYEKVIGSITIEEASFPPDFDFSIGYRVPDNELLCISMVWNNSHYEYLKSIYENN